jgi:hypothetical protein
MAGPKGPGLLMQRFSCVGRESGPPARLSWSFGTIGTVFPAREVLFVPNHGGGARRVESDERGESNFVRRERGAWPQPGTHQLGNTPTAHAPGRLGGQGSTVTASMKGC